MHCPKDKICITVDKRNAISGRENGKRNNLKD